MDTKKIISSKASNVSTKVWMIGCLIIESAMTIVTWAVLPLFFKIWSVVCLMIDAFITAREFVLHPVKQRVTVGVYA